MTPDLDTFLVALYTIIDDLYQDHYPSPAALRCGVKPTMTDSEVLTLAIAAQWLKLPERQLIRFVRAHWQAYFTRLISQSQFNRRFHALTNTFIQLTTQIPKQLKTDLAGYEILDCLPVPLMKKCRGKKAKLFQPEIANIGYGGSDREWYYGLKLGLAVSPLGPITGFILAPAKTGERWPMEHLLCYRHDPLGQPAQLRDLPPSHGKPRVGPDGAIWPHTGIGQGNPRLYLTDRGFSGVWWQEHWEQEYQTLVLNPDSYGGEEAAELRLLHASYRQVIETVGEHLSDDLGLNRLGARSKSGLLARIGAKLLAFNLGVWLNKLFGRPTFAIATLFSF